MVGRLKDFRVETDSTVTLILHDGTNRLVPVQQLETELHSDDYARVSQALALRSDFLERHSSWARPLLVALAVGVVSFSTVKAAQVMQKTLLPQSPKTTVTQAPPTPATASQAPSSAPIAHPDPEQPVASTAPTPSPSNAASGPTVTPSSTPRSVPAHTPSLPAAPSLSQATQPIVQTLPQIPVVTPVVNGVVNGVSNLLTPPIPH